MARAPQLLQKGFPDNNLRNLATADVGTPNATGVSVALPTYASEPKADDITWQVDVANGPATTLQVDLEGCIGDPTVAANWFQIDTYNGVTSTLRSVVNKSLRYVRLRLVTLTVAGVIVNGYISIG